MNVQTTLLPLLILLTTTIVKADFLSEQNRLVKQIFANYDKTLSLYNTLGYNSGEQVFDQPLQLPLSLTLNSLQIFDVDDAQQTISLLTSYEVIWQDARLKWNPNEFGEIQSIILDGSRVWKPEVIPYPVQTIADLHLTTAEPIVLTANGTVVHTLFINTKLHCDLQASEFPFDEQTCFINLICMRCDDDNSNITSSVSSAIQERKKNNVVGNAEWKILNVSNFPDNNVDVKVGSASFLFIMKRRPMFYIYMIMIPTLIIHLLSIHGLFRRKAEQGERLGVGLTNIMTMTFILNILSTEVPKSDALPLLGIYLMIGLGIILGCVIIVLFVPNGIVFATEKVGGWNFRWKKCIPKTYMFDVLGIVAQLLNLANFIVVVCQAEQRSVSSYEKS